MPRALMLTTSLPRDAADPAGRFVAEMARDLATRGWNLRLLAPGPRHPIPGVQLLTYPVPPGLFDGPGAPDNLHHRPLRAGLAALAATASLTAAVRHHHQPDETLIAHWLVPCGLAALTAARTSTPAPARNPSPAPTHARPPIHLIAHGSDIALLETLPTGRALARHLARADAITFVSPDLRDRFTTLIAPTPLPRRCYTLPMGTTPLAPDPATLTHLRALAAGRRIIATIGRLTPQKGLDTLADALAGRRDILWIAAGEGPERAALIHRTTRHQIPFHPTGNLAPPARDALLTLADLFALPSRPLGNRREGTPVALLEALAAGVPTIATHLPGITTAAAPAGALLIPPDDPPALRAAIDALLDDPPRAAALRHQHRTIGQHTRWTHLGPAHAAAFAAHAVGVTTSGPAG